MDSVIVELFEAQRRGVLVSYSRTGDDALISRSRSHAASHFLKSGAAVWMQVDHDIAWEPGDLLALCDEAKKRKTLVAGAYACRAFNRGLASRLASDGVRFELGGSAVHEAEYVATGFLAVERGVLLKMIEELGGPYDVDDNLKIKECIGLNGAESEAFYDFFRCVSVPRTFDKANKADFEYLSEDWAFCLRARACGFTPLVYERPRLRHFGRHGFTLADAYRKG